MRRLFIVAVLVGAAILAFGLCGTGTQESSSHAPASANFGGFPANSGGYADGPRPESTTTAVAPVPTTTAHDESEPELSAAISASRDAEVANLSDSSRSGLPPTLFAELTQLGRDVLTADVLGTGRDRWPSYWPPGPARPCCASMTIHGAGARATGKDRAVVRIVWSADRFVGEPVRFRTSEIPLVRSGGVWGPG